MDYENRSGRIPGMVNIRRVISGVVSVNREVGSSRTGGQRLVAEMSANCRGRETGLELGYFGEGGRRS